MQIEGWYAVYQQGLTGLCLFALLAMGGALCFRYVAPIVERLWRGWLRLDGFGKFVVAVSFIGFTYYGATKSAWQRVSNDGADTNLTGFCGVYQQVSNEVVTVGGVTVTNEIPLVAVAFTGSGITASTPISYRASNTNDWVEIVSLGNFTETDGTTNFLAHIVADKLSYPYWWVGVDKPAVIITTSEINITEYVESSTFLRISWSCSQPLATEFVIYSKKPTEANWTLVSTTSANSITLTGFYVGETRDWKVTSTYLEDGE